MKKWISLCTILILYTIIVLRYRIYVIINLIKIYFLWNWLTNEEEPFQFKFLVLCVYVYMCHIICFILPWLSIMSEMNSGIKNNSKYSYRHLYSDFLSENKRFCTCFTNSRCNFSQRVTSSRPHVHASSYWILVNIFSGYRMQFNSQ